MSVITATAYMEEAERFDHLIAMDDGRVLATGTSQELKRRTQCSTLEAAFIALLPEEKRAGHRAVVLPPRVLHDGPAAIEAEGLTMRFGDFTAVDHVTVKIEIGEIFGFLGSNGCGKTTTMKMLTGLRLSRDDHVTIFISTYFVNEAERCDRISLMHAGKILALDSPVGLQEACGSATLEDAFIGYLEDAAMADALEAVEAVSYAGHRHSGFWRCGLVLSPAPPSPHVGFARREAVELIRDPIRIAFALLGPIVLAISMVNGISHPPAPANFSLGG